MREKAIAARRRVFVGTSQYANPAENAMARIEPERGTMTFQNVVETMAGHDLNHLGQLRRITDACAAKAAKAV